VVYVCVNCFSTLITEDAILNTKEIIRATLISLVAFAIFGTVTAMWENPIFIRKIEVNVWDYVLIVPYVILLGIYFAIKVPVCKKAKTRFGLVFGFLGFACPTCNALFIMMFGSGPILMYFEPIRFYIGVIGIAIMIWALFTKFALKRAYELSQQPA